MASPQRPGAEVRAASYDDVEQGLLRMTQIFNKLLRRIAGKSKSSTMFVNSRLGFIFR
jgi:hypothetical protein